MTPWAARELDRLGYGTSWVHRLDGRAKLVAALVFVGCVASFPKYAVSPLLPYLALPVGLVVVGRIPPRPLLRMMVVASPFAVLVGLFNPLLDRTPRAEIAGLAISGGILSFASILVRFGLCLSMVLVLVATTSIPGLLEGLIRLGIPRPFIAQVHLLYRYLFLLVEQGLRTHQARLLRQPRRRLARPRLAGALLAALLARTWDRAGRIYDCMRVRGFEGSFPSLRTLRFRPTDAGFLLIVVAACVVARILPLPDLLGRITLALGPWS